MSIDALEATDMFCGAGGTSSGARAAGVRVRMAVNHWALAVRTHNTNFPETDHDCADISQTDPRRYPRTAILLASPECTYHSRARSRQPKGATIWDPNGDPAAQRSRATMWDVVRFTEFHRYELIVVENVVEVRLWENFDTWLQAIRDYGYEHRILYLNSAIAHPTPQSRDRIYIVFWKKGNPTPDLEFRPRAWCPACERNVEAIQSFKNPAKRWGRYRAQYVYRCPTCAGIAIPYAWPASSAIDWSLPAPRIGDRRRPLAEATVRRIRAGLERYGPAAIIQRAGHTYEHGNYFRTWPLDGVLPTQIGTAQHALVIDTAYSGRGHGGKVRAVREPLATQTGQQSQALVVPLRRNGRARPLTEPVPTIAAAGTHHGLLMRNYRGGAEMTTPVDEPMRTVTTRDHHSLIALPFLTAYHGQGGQLGPVTSPIRTVDTRDRVGLVEPAIEIDDCGFRMLEPHEIGRAMAFAEDYIVHGSKADQVRQYGNAVTPPMMEMILGPGVASLAGGREIA